MHDLFLQWIYLAQGVHKMSVTSSMSVHCPSPHPDKQLCDHRVAKGTADVERRAAITAAVVDVDLVRLAIRQKIVNQTDILSLNCIQQLLFRKDKKW